jgi:hypothetical protein
MRVAETPCKKPRRSGKKAGGRWQKGWLAEKDILQYEEKELLSRTDNSKF